MKKLKGFSLSRMQSNWYETQTSKSIEFPVEGLDMTPYVINKSSIQDYNITVDEFKDEGNNRLDNIMMEESKFDASKPLLYDLYGVVNHYGSYMGGHYTAYCKNVNEKWYEYNDSSVHQIQDPSSVITDAAYVLFYKRRQV